MALFRRFATVSGFTGVSRVLGFVRDILIANVVGTGPVADAFIVAFRLPNMFRRIFAEGAFNAAFVPLFSRRMEQDGPAVAKAFAEQALAVLLATLLALTAAIMAAMPWFIYVLAPGFAFAEDPEKLDLAVRFSRITFPYLLFMSLTALLSGVLNSLYRFGAAAAAPILLNIFFIAALVLVVPLTGQPGFVMAWTVAAAGAAQFIFLIVAASRAGMALRLPRPRLTPNVRRLLKVMLPALVSAGVLQINIQVSTIIASFEASAVSFLYYADRVYQLPLGLIGIAIGVVLLPELTRNLRGAAPEEAVASLNRGIELSMLLTVPAAVALVVMPWPIVVVLFERGAFDRAASDATALALGAFAVGLPAYVLVKVLQPGYYAREDTMTPLKIAALSVGSNIVLGVVLFWQVGFAGLALATAIAAWLNSALLALGLRRKEYLRLDTRTRSRLLRIVVASLLMGAALWGGLQGLGDWFDAGLWLGIAGLAILVSGGLAGYGALTLAFGIVRLADIKRLLTRAP